MNWLNNFFGKVFSAPQKNTTEAQTQTPQNNTPVDEEYLFDLEEKLLRLDCGLEFAEYIVNELRKESSLTVSGAEKKVFSLCVQTLKSAAQNNLINLAKGTLQIILIVGVNGAGKTTSIGKLAKRFVSQGKKVLIAPCDTFRAAAGEQLQTWAERAGASIHSAEADKKADTVLFEAIQKAKNEAIDILIVDTAGRLQNKKGLMDELAKLANVINKHAPEGSERQSLLVIDATTGQNGFGQAKLFNQATALSGVVLTKFDGTAKGGIVFAIAHNLKIPIQYIGLGEKIDQLQEFQTDQFVSEVMFK
jgi:fused signal recognition particle receptor